MIRYATNYGAGKVHLGGPSRLTLHVTLYCTGRTVTGAFPTDEPVTCKACIKRAKTNGISHASTAGGAALLARRQWFNEKGEER